MGCWSLCQGLSCEYLELGGKGVPSQKENLGREIGGSHLERIFCLFTLPNQRVNSLNLLLRETAEIQLVPFANHTQGQNKSQDKADE